jgi:hypothetical protein
VCAGSNHRRPHDHGSLDEGPLVDPDAPLDAIAL